eukprot:9314305-Pyramimonas_sp.AAC.1
MNDLGDSITKASWRPAPSPATPGDRASKAGSAFIAAKRRVNARPFAHPAPYAAQFYGASDNGKEEHGHGPMDFHDFAATSSRTP